MALQNCIPCGLLALSIGSLLLSGCTNTTADDSMTVDDSTTIATTVSTTTTITTVTTTTTSLIKPFVLHIPTKEIAQGVQMPQISIGTGGEEISRSYLITSTWLSLGGRGIDTAYDYEDQPTVAKAIRDAGIPREDVFITSKLPGCPGKTETAQYINSNLQELQSNYIDLMLIHYPTNDCVDTWEVLEDFYLRGLLKSIGVSHFNSSNLATLFKSARVRPHVNQIQHNIYFHDDETVDYCGKNNVTVEAFSPLGRNGTNRRHGTSLFHDPIVTGIAKKHGVGNAQVALRWIVQQGHMATFQSSSKDHQAEDADVFSFALTDEEITTLNELQTMTSVLV